MNMIDFIESERITGRAYRGNAGMKRAYLHDGTVWMVKFPQSTRDLTGKHLPSYTSSPLSEYIGSHIYASLGIPVHETVLGTCGGKIVVGCKDFTVDADLLDFHGIKNTVDDDFISGSLGSSAHGERLKDVLSVIDHAEDFDGIRNEVKERFWDMFVTDAFIHNNDRNNGNWGLLVSRYTTTIAPVFDNGNAFFNKRNPSVTERRLASEENIADDALNITSFFMDGEDRHIKPLKYIESLRDPDCTAALVRFSERLDMGKVASILSDIPETASGLDVISPSLREHYLRVMEVIVRRSLNPTLDRLGHGLIAVGREAPPVSLGSEAKRARMASVALEQQADAPSLSRDQNQDIGK